MAIVAILETREIKRASRSLGWQPVSHLGGTVSDPFADLPHLPSSIKNMTVDQVLDLIATTFQRPVVYGACAQPTGSKGEKLFWID
jgi:hypothetical protein